MWRSALGPHAWHALLLLAAASLLRFAGLGALGLSGDEDLSAVAVGSLARDGTPHLPSGLLYLRGLPYTVAAAISSHFFSDLEFALRFPSATAGVLTVGILYGVMRSLAGRGPALLGAWLLAFSSWHVDMSREGRMYAMFLAAFLLGVWTFDRWVRDGKGIDRTLALVAGLFTVLLHELGVLLVLVWGLILYARGARRETVRAAAVLALACGLLWGAVQLQFRLALRSFGEIGPSAGDVSLIQSVLHLHHHPTFLLVSAAWDGYRGIYLALAAAGLVATIAWAVREGGSAGVLTARVLGVAAGVFLATTALFGILVAGLFTLAVLAPGQVRAAAGSRAVRGAAGVAGAWLLGWLLFGATWIRSGAGADAGLPALARDLFGYPAPHALVYFDSMPVMTVTVILGTAWFVSSGLSAGALPPGQTILLAWFWLPIVATGFTDRWIALRYIVPTYPAFVILYAATVLGLLGAGARLWAGLPAGSAATRAAPWALGAFLLLVPVANETHGVWPAWRTASLRYGEPIAPEIHGFPFHPDHESAGGWVRERLRPGDLVVAADEVAQTVYAGRVDYWLRSDDDAVYFSYVDGGGRRSFYTRLPVLGRLGELDTLLAANRLGRVWVITSGELTGRLASLNPGGLDRFLSDRAGALAYTARDGATRVYCFPAGAAR